MSVKKPEDETLADEFITNRIKSDDSVSVEEDALISSSDPEHPCNLIPELCRLFYHLGWVTGTG